MNIFSHCGWTWLRFLLSLLAIFCLLALSLCIFYVIMIYAIHDSDEGAISISCESQALSNQVIMQTAIIQNGKKVITHTTATTCPTGLE